MSKKKNFYVVWEGAKIGIFSSWEECAKSIKGYKGARYKGFYTLAEAEIAFSQGPDLSVLELEPALFPCDKPIQISICVDAACKVDEGIMEYRGLYTETKKVLFHKGPFNKASNNIGEFLAIVHALAYMKTKNINLPVYTDSLTAISWIKKRQVNSKVVIGEQVKELIERAIIWLTNNDIKAYKILKWETNKWGEIPADFGRK